MSFDGVVTRAVVHELQALSGGRTSKIYQPQATELIFQIRAGGKNHRLLVSAHPQFARIQLTKESYENPKTPPMFCMFLRKHLEGSIVESIQQFDLERVVMIDFKTTDEIGDITYKRMIVEIMGRHSNIILLDRDKHMILDSIKHIPPSINRYRTVLPGQDYVAPPPQNKINPLTVDEETLLRKVDFNSGRLDKQLVSIFTGFSPLVAKEIIHRAGLANSDTLTKAFFGMQAELKANDYHPQMATTSQGKEFFSAVELSHLDGEKKSFVSIGEMLDRYYYGKAERDRVRQQAHDLEKLLQNERNKNKKKIKKLEKTLDDADKAQRYQLYGELLTAHMHEVNRGDEEAEVMNYYDENGGTVTIPLDAQKTPSENAQRYFQKYNKAKNSVAVVKKQIRKAKREIIYFDGLLQQMESAAPKDVAEIREELEEEGYLKRRQTKRNKKKKNTKPQLEIYRSTEGIEILVGKNNKQNEYLTNRLANANDTWLHTKDIPGSHVVIRNREFNETTLHEAANLASYFSKSKYSSSVPVDYTLIRYVRKPNGAKPGYVIYDNQQTLFVTPDEEMVRKLKK
ncbi:MAG TPA: NFACT RNA binding domain-containing protein [Bacillales bacterium]|nr:NFACT RNA binding domain-containing protein [Bacillales bacterium]